MVAITKKTLVPISLVLAVLSALAPAFFSISSFYAEGKQNTKDIIEIKNENREIKEAINSNLTTMKQDISEIKGYIKAQRRMSED